jgi:hypothetical protein
MNQMQTYFSQDRERKIFKPYTEDGGKLVPGDLIEPLSAHELLSFLANKRREKPDMKKSSLASFKSACLKYRVLNGQSPFTEEEDLQISTYLKGVKNQLSSMVRSGTASSEEGKRHLKFSEYQMLCNKAMSGEIKTKFDTETHLILMLGWNLCARADTICNVHSKHLDWDNDSLLIGIAKSKRNYQENATQFHIYANPIQPELCPVLSLSVHLSTNPSILAQELPLFHKSSSENKGLPRLFSDVAEDLEGVGIHSLRKGGISKASTGTVDNVPTAAVDIRARWNCSDTGVKARYIKYDAAGDQLIGRILAGLPQQSPQFAVLPPHFSEQEHPLVKNYSTLLFGVCNQLTRHLLAQLIYHFDWLMEHL